jgi:hypothetical protein
MNPYTQDVPPEGDASFRGVNLRLRPSLLPPGTLSAATNARLTDGACKPRGGFACKPWATPASLGSAVPVALTNLQGAGVFKDPDDNRWIVIAANGVVYYTRPGNAARVIGLPAGVSLAGQTIEFVQCMNDLMVFRGTGAGQLITPNVTSDFRTITQLDNAGAFADQNPEDGTSTIPPAAWGVTLQLRLLLPNTALGKDILSVSDYFNYTRYQPTLESFRVNQGDDESVLSAFPVPTPDDTPSSAVLVGKDNSIYVVSGIIGDLSGLQRQDVTAEYGMPLRRAIWRVGRDVWFMVPGRGVSSLGQTSQNKWQASDEPVSTEIQPLIERINWNAGAVIRAAKVGNFSYIAVPLDGATSNNAILVYDHLNGAWAGYDTGVSVFEFIPFPIEGVEKLLILTNSGYLGVYGEGHVDQSGASTNTEISHTWQTRGYALRSQLGRLRVQRLSLQLKTRWPRYTLTAGLDGANETRTIASAKTKSRTRYYRPHTRAAWVESNTNNDHATAYREDYSVDLSSATSFNTSGIDLSLLQETTEELRCPNGTRGQFVTFRGSNDRGQCELHGVSLEAVRVEAKRYGSKS